MHYYQILTSENQNFNIIKIREATTTKVYTFKHKQRLTNTLHPTYIKRQINQLFHQCLLLHQKQKTSLLCIKGISVIIYQTITEYQIHSAPSIYRPQIQRNFRNNDTNVVSRSALDAFSKKECQEIPNFEIATALIQQIRHPLPPAVFSECTCCTCCSNNFLSTSTRLQSTETQMSQQHFRGTELSYFIRVYEDRTDYHKKHAQYKFGKIYYVIKLQIKVKIYPSLK
eukprot:TRINITY_DN3355_c0_g2_i2.p1 TRINITY_DN3355_c0_g2~~TRINITY_DN3355_c0_g2_i2.p1  ORF type:complete len:227 (+),score=-18.23 TRINITY_DN3355_c0_g2_i2:485-1165(+)